MGEGAPPMIAVDVPLLGDERLKNWAKIVTSVDDSKSSGWAYQGEFIAAGGIQDVPVGAVILAYGERGSRANPNPEAAVYVANADATLSAHGSARGRAWARTLRDEVEELLTEDRRGGNELEWHPDLMRYSDGAIREEFRRRGLG